MNLDPSSGICVVSYSPVSSIRSLALIDSSLKFSNIRVCALSLVSVTGRLHFGQNQPVFSKFISFIDVWCHHTHDIIWCSGFSCISSCCFIQSVNFIAISRLLMLNKHPFCLLFPHLNEGTIWRYRNQELGIFDHNSIDTDRLANESIANIARCRTKTQ